MEIKPTVRDVRVALHSIGRIVKSSIYNDLRINGGRIKISGICYNAGEMHNAEVLLTLMHPSYEIEVYPFMAWGSISTCISYKKR
jgi:hypothetical protein